MLFYLPREYDHTAKIIVRLLRSMGCTPQQNGANRRAQGGTSRYKGVHKRRGRWLAQIGVKNRILRLGSFDNEEDAAIVYDVAAQLFFGEFARLNFPTAS